MLRHFSAFWLFVSSSLLSLVRVSIPFFLLQLIFVSWFSFRWACFASYLCVHVLSEKFV